MQNPISKILKYIFILFLTGTQLAQSQSINNDLKSADSLFLAKKYTESLSIYNDILESSGKATPAMLLKMAYINEGLESYGDALYHLNNYYSLTSDERALIKMRDLAATQDLEGYEASNLDYLIKFYRQYRFMFVAVVATLGILIIAMIFRQKKKHGKPAPTLGVALVIIVTIGLYLANFTGVKDKGIISNTNTYVMTGPSAGADLVEVVGEGHKVEILSKRDVWVEIKWKEQRAFVRESNIKPLP
jgi:hypothetical protein